MAYLDVLPLEDVKTYLRIDDTQNETDAEITSMIKSALRYVERKTNILVYDRDVDYTVVGGEVNIYDHPINSVESPVTGVTSTDYRHYVNYCVSDSTVDTLTLNVGYVDPDDVPTDLIDVAKVLIKVMFYEQGTQESFTEAIPGWAKDMLNINARFIL